MSSLSFFLYLVFICSWFMHLAARFAVLGTIRFDLLLVAAIGAMAYVNRPKIEGRLPNLLLLLLVYIVLTTPLVEWPGSVIRTGLEKLIKALVFYFFTMWLVTSQRRLKIVVTVFVLCQLFRVVEPVYLHETTGYWGSRATMAGSEDLERLSGSPYDVVNPNGLAFVVLSVFCFSHFLCTLTRRGALAYIAILPVSLYALVLTGSRSGILGLAAAFGAIFLKSRHKMAMFAAAVVACAIAIPQLNADLADRYLSIVSSNTKNAETVDFRISGLQGDLQVAMRRPLFGHGLGTSREANANFAGRDQPSHNLYTEVVQELGLVGLIIFLMIVVTTVGNLRAAVARVRKRPNSGAYLLALCNALSCWMFINVTFSFASYGLTSYEWYFTAGLSEVLLRLTESAQVLPASAPTVTSALPQLGVPQIVAVPRPVHWTMAERRKPRKHTSPRFFD